MIIMNGVRVAIMKVSNADAWFKPQQTSDKEEMDEYWRDVREFKVKELMSNENMSKSEAEKEADKVVNEWK